MLGLLVLAATIGATEAGDLAKAHFDAWISSGRATGASFFAFEAGRLTDELHLGRARPDSLWRVASTSKTFTALLAFRLAERGMVKLDAGLEHDPAVTLRHLLAHTSGYDDPFVGTAYEGGPAQPLYAAQRLFAPGTVRLYSNFGYGLAGRTLEEITGQPYARLMRAEVFETLGMASATLEQPLPPDLAQRVVPMLERSLFGRVHPSAILYQRSVPASGLTLQAKDLVPLVKMVRARGAGFLPAEQFDRMLGESGGDGYGFGFGRSDGHKFWYAGGDLGGHHTSILWFPEIDRAFIALAASAGSQATNGLIPKLVKRWFGPAAPVPPVPPVSIGPRERTWAKEMAGLYRPVRYPHLDLSKTFIITMDQRVSAQGDGSVRFENARWIATGPASLRHEAGVRTVNLARAYERVPWYGSGMLAIGAWFGFIIASVALFWWMHRPAVLVIAIHSVLWLGAVLIADPQRLILGLPWTVRLAIAGGTVVIPLALLWSCWEVWRERTARSLAPVALLTLYAPFCAYWRIFFWP